MAQLQEVFCKTCGKKFFRERGRYNEAKKFGWKQYCSWGCLTQDKITKQILFCENCGRKILRQPSAISVHNFCSHHCSATVSNKNRFDIKNAKMKVCLQCGEQYRKIKGNLKYCSLKCRRNATSHTRQDLIEAIQKTAKRLERTPARRELNMIVDSCVRLFGSWNKTIAAAGLIPNRSHSQRMYKRLCAKAQDGHLCDSISEVLIDDWLFNHKIPHQKDVLYPTSNHKADWGINIGRQLFFIEYFGLANDSPRYDRDIKNKKEICQKNGIPLIDIYPRDLYPKNNLMYKLKFLCQGGESCTPDFRFPKPAS